MTREYIAISYAEDDDDRGFVIKYFLDKDDILMYEIVVLLITTFIMFSITILIVLASIAICM